eukprot:gene17753-biopygen15934
MATVAIATVAIVWQRLPLYGNGCHSMATITIVWQRMPWQRLPYLARGGQARGRGRSNVPLSSPQTPPDDSTLLVVLLASLNHHSPRMLIRASTDLWAARVLIIYSKAASLKRIGSNGPLYSAAGRLVQGDGHGFRTGRASGLAHSRTLQALPPPGVSARRPARRCEEGRWGPPARSAAVAAPLMGGGVDVKGWPFHGFQCIPTAPCRPMPWSVQTPCSTDGVSTALFLPARWSVPWNKRGGFRWDPWNECRRKCRGWRIAWHAALRFVISTVSPADTVLLVLHSRTVSPVMAIVASYLQRWDHLSNSTRTSTWGTGQPETIWNDHLGTSPGGPRARLSPICRVPAPPHYVIPGHADHSRTLPLPNHHGRGFAAAATTAALCCSTPQAWGPHCTAFLAW